MRWLGDMLGAGALRALWARWRAAVLIRRGRRRLERGDLHAAVAALQAALRRRPGSFDALLLLSRAYLRSRDLFRARSALVQARETDRRRFEASAARSVAMEGYDLAGLCPVASGAAPTSVAVEAPRSRRQLGGGDASLPFGDCRDLDEYARFRAMPPIMSREIDGPDWDEVLADLLDE